MAMTAAERAILEAEIAASEARTARLREALRERENVPAKPRRSRRSPPVVSLSDTDRAAAERLARDLGAPVPRKAS